MTHNNNPTHPTDRWGIAPLHLCAYNGSLAVSDVCGRCRELPGLHQGYPKTAELLLQKGANRPDVYSADSSCVARSTDTSSYETKLGCCCPDMPPMFHSPEHLAFWISNQCRRTSQVCKERPGQDAQTEPWLPVWRPRHTVCCNYFSSKFVVRQRSLTGISHGSSSQFLAYVAL